jgi:predicted DNA-binding antitoxin AbrB/MazE fold protein
MGKTLYATFDGHVLKPDSSIELEPNTRVKITIETDDDPKIQKKSFLKTARSLALEGPSDWSSRLEDYLYEEKKANE